ncbi:hypothetical protein F511_01254 [Dorcoceras hygrometricum]|uniref:DUF632 domain-containing protein n=1 Tax=Dorcoceras hygrometricum TaxID=472368 RepID=A0A2Z7BSW5_9LAMI|nr:hypothetical protein F511_01254 [Dorcoceras hygrometricum]
MGCCSSRVDSKLVRLCKERQELIKDARDYQCSLALAHMAYFQSLQDAENEFNNFMKVIVTYHDSPSVAIPDNLKKRFPQLEKSSSGNNDEVKVEEECKDNLNNNCVMGATDSKTCFDGIPGIVLHQPQVAATKMEHLSIRSFEGVTDQSESARLSSSGNLVFPPHRKESFISESQYSVSNTASVAYKRSSMSSDDTKYATPSDNFTDYLPDMLMSNENGASFNGQNAFPHTDLSFYPDENEATENFLMALWHYPWGYQMQSRQHNDMSIWDYLNPFTSVENPYNTGIWDIDLQGVRESEGIPDLEDMGDDEISNEEDLQLNENSEEHHSEAMHEPNENNVKLDQGTRTWNEVENLETQESIEESAQIDDNVVEVSSEALNHSSADLQEVYSKIKEEFENINMQGNYVSDMLDAGKLHHQLGMALFNVFLCRKSNRGSGKVCGMSGRPAYRLPKRKNAASKDHEDTNSTSCNLLLTLEKLYIWESKLYEGVKNEETLKITFDKEWRKLKKLDDQGAESDKLEAHHLSLRKLTSRINLFISKVDRISKQIQKLRDEELQTQVCELIHRLQQMFKVSFECHKKQVQVIMEAKDMVEFSCMSNNSSLRSTRKLEKEILKLGITFSDWIRTHKVFVELLKNWMIKCHLEGSEETTDENTSSPCTNLGAPTVVAICHEWFDAIEKASDIRVLGAINNFTVLLHMLRKLLHKEKHKRLKIQHYSRRYEKKLQNFYRESLDRDVDCDHYESMFNGIQAVDSIEIKDLTLHTMYANLILTRNRLNEAKAEHEEVMKQVKNMVTLIGQSGFLPVLKALESFNLEMLNAFQQDLWRRSGVDTTAVGGMVKLRAPRFMGQME